MEYGATPVTSKNTGSLHSKALGTLVTLCVGVQLSVSRQSDWRTFRHPILPIKKLSAN